MSEEYRVNGIFDETFDKLERAMKVATARQEIISQNIANAKTPGYEPLEFDAHLMRAEKRQEQKQVVMEQELAALAKNSNDYSSLVKIFTSRLNNLRTIATQGRR